ncbi:MAG: N-acetylmuramoyl-L-alanine amidase, partial [Oscillospiraceae bacterium]|nr:N-acetylmuramoyl-L-alanine amidase [Oscillospiraceae bacterium]
MKKVFIGVGHGGTDPGAVKYITEKEYTLKTAKAVAEYLEEYGIGYKLSRTADIDTDMDSKV